MQGINLANLGGGVAIEKFQEEFSRLIENVLDPNTEPTAKREVILKVVVKPTKDRTWGNIQVLSSSKLAANVAYATRAYFGMTEDGPVACEDNPNQMTFEDLAEEQSKNVADFPSKKTKEH